MTNKKKAAILGLMVLAVAAAVLIYRDTRTSKIEITGTGVDALKDYGIGMTGNGKVEVVPIEGKKLPPAPSLDRVVTPLKTLDAALVKNMEGKMAATVALLKEDATKQDAWIALGGQRKVLGDYEGARDAWEYAKALAPTDLVAWNNLADLYHFYLKDFVKSEENWKKTIAIKSDYIAGYRGLYELYAYSMTAKKDQAPVILKEGIAKNPSATDLNALLAEYEKSVAK